MFSSRTKANKTAHFNLNIDSILSGEHEVNTTVHLIKLADTFPEYAGTLIDRLLANDEHFYRIVGHITFFKNLVIRFPNHAEMLLQKLLSNDEYFFKVINNDMHLRNANSKEILQKVLGSPLHLPSIITNAQSVIELADTFPDQAETLIKRVLENATYFQKIVSTPEALTALTKRFPQHEDEMLEKVFSSTSHKRLIIASEVQFIYLIKNFPEYAGILLQNVLDDHVLFKKIASTAAQLITLSKELAMLAETIFFASDSARSIIFAMTLAIMNKRLEDDSLPLVISHFDLIYLAKAFPTFAEKLMAQVFLNDKSFRQVVTNADMLIVLATHFKAYATDIIDKLIGSAENYHHIVKNSDDLTALIAHFPTHEYRLRQMSLSAPKKPAIKIQTDQMAILSQATAEDIVGRTVVANLAYQQSREHKATSLIAGAWR